MVDRVCDVARLVYVIMYTANIVFSMHSVCGPHGLHKCVYQCRFFPAALDVGCGRGHIAKEMNSDIVGTLYQCDMAENMVVCILLIFYLFYIFIHTRVLPFLSACVGYFN